MSRSAIIRRRRHIKHVSLLVYLLLQATSRHPASPAFRAQHGVDRNAPRAAQGRGGAGGEGADEGDGAPGGTEPVSGSARRVVTSGAPDTTAVRQGRPS